MPIWASLYLLLIAGLSVWAITDDLRQGESKLRAVADVASIIALGYLYMDYFDGNAEQLLGRVAAPLFLLAFTWTGIAAKREVQEEDPDPELSPRENFVAEHLGIAVGVLIFAPLIAFAGASAFQQW